MTFISITGTSLHDLPRTMAGYVMYDNAANPKGAAVVMDMEHCKKRRRSVERGIVGFDGCIPLAVSVVFPFCFGKDERASVSSPKICESV
jgi:hypothetical protein